MKFITIRDLRSNTARLRRELQAENEIIVTANGRPFAVMTPVQPDNVEEEVRAIRRARGLAALDRIQAKAKAQGLDKMTMEEIDAVVAETRRERRSGK
jgi:antitoxin (DNA-binding transcriptional repressor) of toxin-antitoxin stability system